jgi:deoxyribose-phosphate aldolase
VYPEHVTTARAGRCGFKAAGGVGQAHVALAEARLGAAWIAPERFRFGASALLGAVTAALAE